MGRVDGVTKKIERFQACKTFFQKRGVGSASTAEGWVKQTRNKGEGRSRFEQSAGEKKAEAQVNRDHGATHSKGRR